MNPGNLENQIQGLPGVFVVIEGPDGSGKTSVMSKVLRFLDEKAPVILTEEPWHTSIKTWLSEEHSPLSTTLAMVGDRLDHLSRLIIPELEKGKIVVSSRYSASTWVYNIRRLSSVLDVQSGLFQLAIQVTQLTPLPELQFIVTANPEELLKRVNTRDTDTSVDDSGFSLQDFESLVEGYELIPEFEPVNKVFDSTEMSATDIAQEIADCVYSRWLQKLNRLKLQKEGKDDV